MLAGKGTEEQTGPESKAESYSPSPESYEQELKRKIQPLPTTSEYRLNLNSRNRPIAIEDYFNTSSS
jgi:hypothetical protein